ncbi:hypothetical protein COY16_02160 [Candidatus Roizmanbacteria bacterium CG_4_10_14_0_2_um_filter_39_13]|uniref:LysM domain-containing protein n=1 Tax=Candidatus Roizmanbacteria bacterium CG_4_10_14_0_2_um_filter_39_13 TaxID=1974825 RepID=A0A2M7U0C3_9BACT|nr:MAG: hypothetical protein COY16_02160 [Candidatus Roizmanbacteria bacterium CG_4_10_14_0_2_um_filter_39_13]
MEKRRRWSELSLREKAGATSLGIVILSVLFGCGGAEDVAQVVASRDPEVYKLVIVGTGDSYSIIAQACAPNLSYLDLQELNGGKGLFAGDTVKVSPSSSCLAADTYELNLRANCDVNQTLFAEWNDNVDSFATKSNLPAAAIVRLNDFESSRSATIQQGKQYWTAMNCRNGFDPWKVR